MVQHTGFNDIYLSYQDKFIRFAMFYVSNRQVAEDIVTDSFMNYWERRKSLPADINIPAYILTCVKNRCLTFLRDTRLHEEALLGIKELEEWKIQVKISSLEACDPFELFTSEMQELVNRAIDSLPTKTKHIFVMSRLEELSHKEIAAKTGLSTKSVEFHLAKATKILREKLKDYYILILFI